jgi:hypothetical protein
MERKEIIENYEEFVKCYKEYEIKNKKLLNFEKFEKIFGVKSFFIDTKAMFFEDKFFEKIIDIVAFNLKHFMHEIEHYANMKPANQILSTYYEVLKEDKIIQKLYFKNHKHYRKYMLMLLENKENSLDVIEYLQESFDLIKENIDYLIPLNCKLIDEIEEKIEKISDKKKQKFESAIFN